jgi:uncharacterized protein (TIGR02646 family)
VRKFIHNSSPRGFDTKLTPIDNTDASKKWRKFSGKRKLTKHLATNSDWLCAYSEMNALEYNYFYHIEHIKPRSLFPKLTFEYTNLLPNALSDKDLRKIQKEDYFGGHYKSDKYDEDLFITPCENNTEKYFRYSTDGSINIANHLTDTEREKALYTREILNLNSPILVSKRKAFLQNLIDEIDENLEDPEYIEKLKKYHLTTNGEDTPSFISAAKQLFDSLA